MFPYVCGAVKEASDAHRFEVGNGGEHLHVHALDWNVDAREHLDSNAARDAMSLLQAKHGLHLLRWQAALVARPERAHADRVCLEVLVGTRGVAGCVACGYECAVLCATQLSVDECSSSSLIQLARLTLLASLDLGRARLLATLALGVFSGTTVLLGEQGSDVGRELNGLATHSTRPSLRRTLAEACARAREGVDSPRQRVEGAHLALKGGGFELRTEAALARHRHKVIVGPAAEHI